MPIDPAEFAQALLETRNQRSPRGGRACAQEADDIDWLLRSCNRLATSAAAPATSVMNPRRCIANPTMLPARA